MALNAGDIAFVDFNSDNPDEFAVVALTTIAAGEEIKFTDNGVFAAGGFRANEGVLLFTATAEIPAGTVFNPLDTAVAAGGSFALSTAGDQIIAYQGDEASPTFLAAIDFDSAGYVEATSSNDTGLPDGLAVGATALDLGEADGGSYFGPQTGTRAELLAAINDPSNWETGDSFIVFPRAAFTVTDASSGGGGGGGGGQPLVINEVLGSTTSSDTEFVELFGEPGASLEGLSIIVVESDAGASNGTIDRRFDFEAGDAIGDNGFFLLGNDSEVVDDFGVTPNKIIADNFIENSSYTLALVETASLSGSTVTGAEVVIDAVGVSDGGAGDSFFFGAPVIGPDGTFLPAGVRREVDGLGDFVVNDAFNPPGEATPTAGESLPQPTVINELLVSTTSTDVEFIEIFGEPGAALAGLSILNIESDDDSGNIDNRFDIPDGAVIGENGFFLIGNSLVAGALGVTPNLELPSNFFENSSSTIALVETATITGDSVDGTETAIDAVALTDGAAGTFYYGAPVLGPDGGFYPSSVTRAPDGGDFELVDAFSPAGVNTTPIAGAFPVAFTDRKIHEIQGSTDLADGTLVGVAGAADESPLLGEGVRIQGVVTAVLAGLGGFYVQEEDTDADADAFSSEGVFVASTEAVTVGQIVTVEGVVAEVEGETRVNASGVAIDDAGDNSALVTETVIEFPTATVLQDTDGDFVANLEAYEGMLVTIPEQMTVTELFQLDRFGSIRVSSEGRLEQFTQGAAPDAAGYEQHLKDIAARSLIIDDGLDSQNPSEISVPGLGADGTLDAGDVFRMGDAFTDVTGVLSYSEDDQTGSEEPEYRIHTPEATLEQLNDRQETPDDVGGSLKVASFNVLNFFTTLDTFPGNEQVGPNDLDPRGADTNPQNALPGTGETDEYDRQLTKLIEAIGTIEADILGLIELENDFLLGGESPGDTDAQGDRGVAIQALVDGLNATFSVAYDWVRPGENVEFVGGDAIAVGFIYNTETIGLSGDAAILDDASFVDPNGTGTGRNRAALAQTFEEKSSGGEFTVAVNHFKSKGASGLDANGDGVPDDPTNPDSDQLDGAGYWNDTRTKAAEALAAWLAGDPTGSGDEDVMILGDLNAYAQEDPIKALEAAGFTDLATAFLGDDGYSFVFDGQTGTLDYAFANESLYAQVTGATEWHINADEADAFDYNLEFGRDPALFTGDADTNLADNPYRASDHDPVLIGLALESDSAPTPVFQFAGVNEYRGVKSDIDNIAHQEVLEQEDITLTFSFIADSFNRRQGVITKDARFNGDGGHISVLLQGDDLDVRLQDTDSEFVLNFDNIDADREYEVAVVITNDLAQLWVDGALIEETTEIDATWDTNTEYLNIGGNGWASDPGSSRVTDPFDGKIADVEVYAQQLNEEQIQELAALSSFDLV